MKRDAIILTPGEVPSRLPVLDGWRAISILFVLAGHMLPLGPKAWQMNAAVASAGMSIFFTLSGFLIVGILIRNQDVVAFLVKRVLRIVPLAWLYLAVVLAWGGASASYWAANFLFVGNLPPFYLDYASHFWSLCVEMQFYAVAALLVLVGGRKGLYAVPVLAVAVTLFRAWTGTTISVVTWFRVDEILAGGILALIAYGALGTRASRICRLLPAPVILMLVIAAAHPEAGPLAYARGYLASIMVGATLFRPADLTVDLLRTRPLAYVAKTSYALYVFHPLTVGGWLGTGGTAERYLIKRPISFALTFALAHISTFHFERHFIELSHRIAKRRGAGGVDKREQTAI